MKGIWWNAPLDKRNWPEWAPVLWASDFRTRDILSWIVVVFTDWDVQTKVRAKLMSIAGTNLYSFGRYAPPSEQAAVWHFLRRSLGYTEEVDCDD